MHTETVTRQYECLNYLEEEQQYQLLQKVMDRQLQYHFSDLNLNEWVCHCLELVEYY
jgi:hypothetical protein